MKKILLLIMCIVLNTNIYAVDPIKWKNTQIFPGIIFSAGGTYLAKYDFTNMIPFTMVSPLYILKSTNYPREFTFDDNCSGRRLNQFETCTVKIYLDPIASGEKTVQLTQSYGNNRVPLPLTKALAATANGGTGLMGSVTTSLPATLAINSSAPWRFTFTNNGSKTATGLNLHVNGSAFTTTCGSELSSLPGSNSCYVAGTYTAEGDGVQTIYASLAHAQGSSVDLQTSTNGDGSSSGLVCNAAVPLAPQTLINTSNNVTLLCTNKSGSPLTIDGRTTNFPNSVSEGVFTIASGGDNCTAQTLNNDASCQLKGVYAAPGSAINNINIALSVNYQTSTTSGLTAETATTTDVVTTISNNRIINLVNNCNFDVWWSMVGGAITNSPSCPTTACPDGSTCNSGTCYYNNYGPTSGEYYLVKNGGTATTKIIQTDASTVSNEVLWKGVISASTGCSGSSCANNECSNNSGTTSCAAGVGFQQPATEAEFTFKLTGSGNLDTYDISHVNGFSMPMSMATNQTSSDFTCGNAGNNQAVGNLTACDFNNVNVPTNMYYWVTNTGTACQSGNTCSNSSELCGLAFSSSANSFVKNCGSFLGFWQANQICQTDTSYKSEFGDNFSCAQYLTSPFPDNTYTLTNLLKCSPPNTAAPLFNSCYLNYSGATTKELKQCCGCTNWDGIAYVSEQCPTNQTDPQWLENVYDLISWMKRACPTAYAYPYDDKASTFQCTADQSTEYTVTFCPGGDTGLPANITDGRM